VDQQLSVLMHAENILSPGQLADALLESWRYFAELKQPLPPLPDDIAKYVGCDFQITEAVSENGTRTGKLTLTQDGVVRYNSDWVISSAKT
jgi:hypothetical protein